MLELTRRELISSAIAAAGLMASSPISSAAAPKKPIVYWTPELSGDALLRLYQLINKDITGRVALKLHTGEPGGPNILPREWIKQFQRAVPQSTIVESNVLYKSPRQTSEGHRRVLAQNGWNFCPVDILDEEGDTLLPVKGGMHLKQFHVGKHFFNYDSMVVLTHFKGHGMVGFGGSLKNIAIGRTRQSGSACGKSRRELDDRCSLHGTHGRRRQGHYGALRETNRLPERAA